jgi:hypothetical protein
MGGDRTMGGDLESRFPESEFPFVLATLVLWMDWLAVPCVFRALHGSGRAYGNLRSTTRVSCFLVVPVLLSLR